MSRYRSLTRLAAAAVLALGLAACSSSDDPPPPPPEPAPVEPSAYETGKAAIMAAADADAAQEIIDALDTSAVTAAELAELTMLVSDRRMAEDVAAATAARQMLVDAAMCTATTDACLEAHDALIAALEGDLRALQASDDATNAEEQAARDAIYAARMKRDMVQMAADEIDRSTDLGSAVGAAVDAANGLADERSPEDVENAEMLLATAQGMVTEADDYADEIAMAQMAIDRAKARNAVDTAVMAAETASNMLADDQSKATVEAARAMVEAAKQAVMDNADDLTDSDESGFNAQIALAEAPIGPLESKIAAEEEAEAQRMADEEAEEQRKANEAMAATAAKLYAGINAPSGDANSAAPNDFAAAYNNAGTPAGATVDTSILVTIGTTDAGGTAIAGPVVALSENKKATVADHHGWEGKMYADLPGGDVYEAIVYSNVEDPEEGDKFGQIGVTTPANGYQYGLSATGQVAVNTSSTAAYVDLIDSSNFDHTAGVKRFPLPDPNPGLATVVSVPGTFHGVSGTYTCTPGATVCAANVSGDGFELGTVPSATDATFTDGGGTWMFMPSNPEARVMEMVDTMYASYGWWIKKAENDGPFTASAFHDEKGGVPAAAGLNDLNGTATYMGGAAGKYALSSSTGGTNDAGHFTARATLEADFTNNTDPAAITGTLDMFMGADDQMRDWEVQLKGSTIGDTGAIGNDGTSTTSPGGTIWTIGDTAADAGGNWTGLLRNNGADGVPEVATGTFYSTYSVDSGATAGRMVGAFGANVQ